MMNKIISMLWLRSRQIITNPQFLILILLPYLFVFLYEKAFPESAMTTELILFVCLPMILTLSVGNLILTIVAEEKEKNNIRDLYLAGVKSSEYLISTLFIPIIIGISGIILVPLIINYNITENFLSYLIITLMTMLSIALINLFIALVSSTVSQATVLALPLTLIAMLLPMFSILNKTVERINKFTFMGSFTEYVSPTETFKFDNTSFISLLVWIFISLILIYFNFNKSKKNS